MWQHDRHPGSCKRRLRIATREIKRLSGRWRKRLNGEVNLLTWRGNKRRKKTRSHRYSTKHQAFGLKKPRPSWLQKLLLLREYVILELLKEKSSVMQHQNSGQVIFSTAAMNFNLEPKKTHQMPKERQYGVGREAWISMKGNQL
ncbi:uncharacterized protein LOC129134785 [Agelaius phoeniceus]|uniref:uncharacterized protein LOC129134785 n=1 Tax=Agelaius phoeniceus TaxID=39638 RepID=UPI004054CEB5